MPKIFFLIKKIAER